ncbi:aminoacyl-tRNA deacylase [Bacillus vallismortis]|uniref:aminoacyl-tRNA deacylase n=1 Tax=Bacillus vallismortis TaxID=72361 RepID=UPI000289F3E5|nr:aminoacyl-tRNA deacylase [Bacillus vallismortis]MBG9771292.1 prolyl-tRNA synthetase [Bacillus vallismortis]MCY8425779.1 aminoacyl-tRNA deacylase [Bacillus vallismortis]MEC1269379.1 aminoacyl-tRNA deacylase [Bacillus vallismortis]MEC1650896.1 aminoacyl-tRNA deacylase [Bacillus vallismortis]QAV10042.1 deacylase [Bacillus vallismortis]
MNKLPAHLFLDDLKLEYTSMSFSTSTEKGAANVAKELNFNERQMVKTLIFETGQSEKILVMVGGDQNIKSGKLKKAVGSKNIKMASPATVKELTGYQIGSIPPFGWQPTHFRSFIDRTLMKEDTLGVGAGVWGNEIIITPQNLKRASKAQEVDIVTEQ